MLISSVVDFLDERRNLTGYIASESSYLKDVDAFITCSIHNSPMRCGVGGDGAGECNITELGALDADLGLIVRPKTGVRHCWPN